MQKLRSILQRLAALEGNLEKELARLARLRRRGELLLSDGVRRNGNTPKTLRQMIDLFRSKVQSFPEGDACWEWHPDFLNQSGYGDICIGASHILAHRMSFVLFNGREPWAFVCHHCDNPRCVNPDHFFEGTNKENIQDCVRKGRMNDRRGEKNIKAKLTTEQVLAIRAADVSSRSAITKLRLYYGVDDSTIRFILEGKTWKHLLPAPSLDPNDY